MRFANKCRKKSPTTRCSEIQDQALSATECRNARHFWIRVIQAVIFSKEFQALRNNQPLPSGSPLAALRPFLDEEEIIRIGGRLRHSALSFAAKNPILLAPHPIVKLILRHSHVRALHAGVQLTLATVRQDYWVLRARTQVKQIIHQCVNCVREKAEIPAQLMGDLPQARISTPARAFSHAGVDYAGPIVTRASSGRGITARKGYIVLFICLASRAVHLELASNYSTEAFLDAFSRFCARRGLPSTMYSDNGTTFAGADTVLSKAYQNAMRNPDFQNKIATENIIWHFIPPHAPHFGGLWEAGVRSVKYHLRRILGAHTLTYEEFSTLLCRIEVCLNSRPIGPLTDILDDYSPLTPGHFLIGSSITVNPEPSILSVNENRLSRWQLIRQLTERFWKIWQTDYVNTLQQRIKWRQVQPSVKTDSMVLIRNPLLPPCKGN
ncbi:uncharacterized protein LOC112638782 [Camponotus floridanus]|uniref:uncharacterized protein LOC112638782 n=1 Tax=Camponotus floridanus TaxID=104421 RepID=UPI000DC6AD5C|nr:uncharacterized protein LOC112638782 [Camponotus floridanus]